MAKYPKKIHIEDLEFFHLYTKATLKKLLRKAEEQSNIINEAKYMIKHTIDNYDNIVEKAKQDSREKPIAMMVDYKNVFEFLTHYIYTMFENYDQSKEIRLEIGSKDLYELYKKHENSINITANRFGRILTFFCDRNDLTFEKLVKADKHGFAKRFYVISKKEQNL